MGLIKMRAFREISSFITYAINKAGVGEAFKVIFKYFFNFYYFFFFILNNKYFFCQLHFSENVNYIQFFFRLKIEFT